MNRVSFAALLLICFSMGGNVGSVDTSVENCKHDGYKKIGCFTQNDKLLPEVLITDLDPSHHNWGKEIDWLNFQQSLHSLACRCEEKARGRYKYFSIGYYGECWGSSSSKIGGSPPTGICVGGDYGECNHQSKEECAGIEGNEYVYEIVEANNYNLNPTTEAPTTKECWSVKSPGCVNGHDLVSYPISVDECKEMCLGDPYCLAFEYGVAHGGSNTEYSPGQCVMNDGADSANCDGQLNNLDLYVKVNCAEAPCEEVNVALIGHNINRPRPPKVDSWEDCSEHCRNIPACTWWTYNKRSRRCSAKKSDSGRRSLAGFVSGSRSCGALDSTPPPPSPLPIIPPTYEDYPYNDYKDKECEAMIWEPRGCYDTKRFLVRGQLLVYWRYDIEWSMDRMPAFAASFVCACAEAARAANVKFFSTHFWGECWSLEMSQVQEAPDGDCTLADGEYETKCHGSQRYDFECLGGLRSYYLYSLL